MRKKLRDKHISEVASTAVKRSRAVTMSTVKTYTYIFPIFIPFLLLPCPRLRLLYVASVCVIIVLLFFKRLGNLFLRYICGRIIFMKIWYFIRSGHFVDASLPNTRFLVCIVLFTRSVGFSALLYRITAEAIVGRQSRDMHSLKSKNF